MKLWLFDILACPIDKYYPLKLYIFSFETTEDQFKSFLEVYKNKNLDKIRSEGLISIKETPNGIYIKDGIILKEKPISDYLSKISKSIYELDNVYDRTSLITSKRCFEILNMRVKEQLVLFSKKLDTKNINEILPDLYLLNKIKLGTEIATGALFCEECKRWYPIVETIPQMLPDNYRDKESDLKFLKNHKNLFDPEFFQQNLKPFHL